MSAADFDNRGEQERGASIASRPVTLRVLVEGAGRHSKTDVVKHLAAVNGQPTETVRGPGGQALAIWLTFSAGWYEGHPLRFEVVATAPGLGLDKRRVLAATADAVIFVADCAESDWPFAVDQLRALDLGSDGRRQDDRLVVFGHRSNDTGLEPADVMQVLGLDPETSIAMTSPEGAGVRYGFALAVRLGLAQLRTRDGRNLPRRSPSSAAELRDALSPLTPPVSPAWREEGVAVADASGPEPPQPPAYPSPVAPGAAVGTNGHGPAVAVTDGGPGEPIETHPTTGTDGRETEGAVGAPEVGPPAAYGEEGPVTGAWSPPAHRDRELSLSRPVNIIDPPAVAEVRAAVPPSRDASTSNRVINRSAVPERASKEDQFIHEFMPDVYQELWPLEVEEEPERRPSAEPIVTTEQPVVAQAPGPSLLSVGARVRRLPPWVVVAAAALLVMIIVALTLG